MKFRPSVRTEVIKLFIFILLSVIFYIISTNVDLPKETYFIVLEGKSTFIGTSRSVVSPIPSWPLLLYPHI